MKLIQENVARKRTRQDGTKTEGQNYKESYSRMKIISNIFCQFVVWLQKCKSDMIYGLQR